MAHRVKCSICNETFDRDKVECVATSARRYAHKSCYDRQQGQLSEEEKAREEIFKYLKQLFKENFNKVKIETQLEKMIRENKYNYSGVLKTLVYWYEVKNGDVEKSHYSIGIVPYIYKDAYNYYYNIWLAQQANADKNIEIFKPKEKIVVIKNPVRKPKIKRNIFSFKFLDEEGYDV